MTYSIVARDPATGELGVAVQSHWFAVGPVVPWAQPGVGAVATQANVDVRYGPHALARLRAGEAASDALAALVAVDSHAGGRQVAVVDARGRVAVHTGGSCMAFAGHLVGEGFSCQANMMAGERVWTEMAAAFARGRGTLADRLLDALDAGEAAGGDVRGRQSAAIVVVPRSGEPWERVVDLRVDDHPEPLPELRRLVELHRAYALATEGDRLAGEHRHAEAGRMYVRASAAAPENAELLFWAGLSLAHGGDLAGGAARVREAIGRHAGWRDLLERLSPEQAPAARAVLAALDEGGGPA